MSNVKTVDINVSTAKGPVISQQIRIYQRIKGFYGCQGECKKNFSEWSVTPTGMTTPVWKAAYNIKTIVCTLSHEQVNRLLAEGWLHCSVCRHAFDPTICPGKKRKFCPCCTTRLRMLKRVLNDSISKKIQNTILISRIGDD